MRRFARLCALLMLIVFAGVFAGFLWFADSVTSMRAPSQAKADAIVVLTGGYQRIDQAVSLLAEGAGGRLLISGVHPSTTPSQIRKMTQGPKDLFSCCVDIGYDALDTIGNANETVRWIHNNGYRSILVVTNNYHMPRSLLELRRLDPATAFIPYPVVNADLKRKNWFMEPNALRTLLSEYGKILITSVRDYTGMHKATGLRDEKAAIASVQDAP